MTDLFLVAISVRGAAAFDIAEQIECPFCKGKGEMDHWPEEEAIACDSCDGEGFWYISSVYGHRCIAWRHWNLSELEGDLGQGYFNAIVHEIPKGWPDHFTNNDARVSDEGSSLIERLGIRKRTLGIARRI